uniref:Uncharacterized protein n=1 Tax=Kryptolebias marmoratus TaxID=37003 RepID=A0A3Q3ABL5_KRYMA
GCWFTCGRRSGFTAGDTQGSLQATLRVHCGRRSGFTCGQRSGFTCGRRSGFTCGRRSGFTAGDAEGSPAGDAEGSPAGDAQGSPAGGSGNRCGPQTGLAGRSVPYRPSSNRYAYFRLSSV